MDERAPTPSRYRLPQTCSDDRKRARQATLALQRQSYQIASDDGPGNPAAGFRLPIGAALLPPGEAFAAEKKARLLGHKAILKMRSPFIRGRVHKRPSTERDYVRLIGWLRHPVATRYWSDDAEFARQRLTGTNPMALRRCDTAPNAALAAAAGLVLKERYGGLKLKDVVDSGRLFCSEYPHLIDGRIQRQVVRGARLAVPTCLFLLAEGGKLAPLAIELMPSGEPGHAVFNPLDRREHWLLARSHAQAADAHYHEAVYHLLETHMVSEIFALCTARQLHPDHPLNQLLKPHFEDTLAINYLARHDLLSRGGPIDVVLAAGVGGALDLARLVWSSWDFRERTLDADLCARGLDDAAQLPGFHYRDDARAIWVLLNEYVDGVLGWWYRGDEDVREDFELSAWSRDVAQHVRGFPASIETRAQLVDLATHVIFRASAQHSAVNNGQFQGYGFVPNSPGVVFAWPPQEGEARFEMRDLLGAFADRERAVAQLGMAWVLSQPTHRSLLTTGTSPAFTREISPAAHDATLALRRRLVDLGEKIAARNRAAAHLYSYLSPYDVGRSTAV